MLNLDILGSLASQLHQEFRNLFYMLLPVFFLASVTITWFRGPAAGPDFIEALKRVVVASLLLAAFPEIVDAILLITTALKDRISDMSGLESYMRMIGEKAGSLTSSPFSALYAIDDFLMALVTYLSFLLVFVVRILMLAVYQFTWCFLIILSPFLLLFHVFGPKLTVNLFRTLVEVASWPVVWSVLSAMLKSLPFGSLQAADSGRLTIIVLNIIITMALILTPFLIKGLASGAFSAVASSLLPITAAAMKALPAKAVPMARYVATGATGGSSASKAAMNSVPRAPKSLRQNPNFGSSPASQMSPTPIDQGPPPWQTPPKKPKTQETKENE